MKNYLNLKWVLYSIFYILSSSISLIAQTEKSNLSPNFECEDSNPLRIIYFRHANTDTNWKIVLEDEIEYSASQPFGTSNNYNWRMGNIVGNNFTSIWQFSLDSPPSLDLGTTQISNNLSTPSDNTDFGSINGVVQLIAEIGGNSESVLSTEMTPPERVEVFFKKDENSFYEPMLPNWFYYWSQANLITAQLTIPGIRLYNINTCSFDPDPTPVTLELKYDGIGSPYNPAPGAVNTYGSNRFNMANFIKTDPFEDCGQNAPSSVISGYNEASEGDGTTIIIGEGCGFIKQSPANPNDNINGIHTFYTTLVHEVEHALIKCEVWGPGFASNLDSDLDGYRDSWETNEAPSTPSIMFMVGPNVPNDSYSGNYDTNLLGQVPPIYSAGTEYEEGRCRAKESTLITSGQIDNINIFDWSYDPTNIVQGQNW